MSTEKYYSNPKMLRRMHEGPLGSYIDLFADRLHKEGHSLQSAWRNLRVACDFSHWLARERLGLGELDERIVEQYQRFRSRYRCPFASDRRALLRLLSVLREAEAIVLECPTTVGRLEQIECDFEQYLTEQCGLAHVLVIRHKPTVLQFLREQFAGGDCSLSLLTATDVTRFVKRHVADHSSRSAQMMCWTLRSFLKN